jgi:hypothetical protein
MQRDEDADHGLLAIDHTPEIPHVLHAGAAGLHGEDDLLRRLVPAHEVDAPVDALVGPLLLDDGPSVSSSIVDGLRCPDEKSARCFFVPNVLSVDSGSFSYP